MLLENSTIKLRALEPEDLDVLYQWENDTDLWQYGSTIAPYSKYVLKEYLSDSRQDLFLSKQLRLVIVWKESFQAVGTLDLYDFDPMNFRAGIGILIDGNFRSRGIGFQALKLMEEYALSFLRLKQLYAYIPLKNKASLNLFFHAGYRSAGILKSWLRISQNFEDVNLMQLIQHAE